jgi:hypothetical protein
MRPLLETVAKVKEPRPRRSWPGRSRGFLLGLLGSAALLGATSPGIKILSDRTFPHEPQFLTDIRWAADDTLYVGAARDGVLRLPFEPAWGRPSAVLSTTTGHRNVWGASRIGISQDYLAGAPEAFAVGWKRLPDGPFETEAFAGIVDLDVWRDRLVLLGVRRDEQGRFAPDGAIAWVGSLSKGLKDLKAVRYSVFGPGVHGSMDSCGPFEIGGARFLADGRFVVVPGSEPGVFLYDAAGKLLRTWETGPLGLDTDCRMKEEQRHQLLADLQARTEWINQRRTLDEIVPLPHGFGLAVRSFTGGAARWRLVVLEEKGKVSSLDLPFTCPAPTCELSADVRGDRIAFLVAPADPSSEVPRRLVMTSLP